MMLNAILSIAGSSHQGHERFSEVSRGRQCSFMSFSALSCAQLCVSNAALGYCYSWPILNQRRHDVLECTWKSKNFRWRHVVPDLPAKSSSLDSSFARHWGHRTKSIARWGNKIALWGKQFKKIARWGEDYFKQITYYYDKHWSTHCWFLLHCYYMTRRICGIKQVIIIAFFGWLHIMFTLFPSLAITSFLYFSYWGITFTQSVTNCPGINCYYKHQSSSLLLLPLFL